MNRKIALVCDSAADFPPGVTEKLGLRILPVHIFVNGKDHLHGKTISNKEVISNLRGKKNVYTSPFYPYECTKMFDKLLEDHDEVVSFHLSSQLSGNYKSACSARNFMGKDDSGRVHIIDLGAVSISQGLLVRKAAGLLEEGVPAALLEKHLEQHKKDTFMAFTVDNLVWLKKGGRISAFNAFVGNMLNVKPIINLQDSRLMPVERHRGKKSSTEHLLSMAEKNYENLDGNCEVWMAYADNPEEVVAAREKLASAIDLPAENIPMAELGATISVHTGPGSIFIAMAPK
ncbi:MAG: DegV family protein [Desulfosalsimonas sp.]